MASGGKRGGGGGERVLESRHVIGLFMLMLLFSGVFFTLGYLMGRDQGGGPVQAATDFFNRPLKAISAKPDVAAKHTNSQPPSVPPSDTSGPWEIYPAGDAKKTDDRLRPAASPSTRKEPPALVKTASSKNVPGKPVANSPNLPGTTYTLQVAAVKREADALELAGRLQKKKFPAFVLSPQTDKYYRVQVGPYLDPKAAELARKGLEGAGFKAIVKH